MKTLFWMGVSTLVAGSTVLWGAGSKDVPAWVDEVATRAVPAYPGKVPAAYLLDEEQVDFEASGMVTTTERVAVKILNQQGRSEAKVGVPYWKNKREVKDLHAWTIAPSGFKKTYDKNDVIDVGRFVDSELYSEGRARYIRAQNPEIGSVFAYEYTTTQKALTAGDEFEFQHQFPAVRSVYKLHLPAGWTAKGVIFNHAPIEPIVDGSTYTWELKELPYREREDHAPSMQGLAPRLVVSFQPPSGASSPTPVFRTWKDVSIYQDSLAAGQDEVTPAISAKAAELTAGATTDLDKIRAIGHYVQTIRYVAIEMDLLNGGGYKPNSADVVLAKHYGDCKDKANLMRSLMKAAGMRCYLTAIYSGDRTYVQESWPSPYQFNHMIVAASVPAGVKANSVISSPVGPVLIFDPTDDRTPVGDLPWYEQSSLALLIAGDKGDLLKMPSIGPDANTTSLTIQAELDPAGKLKASFTSEKEGQPASTERRRHADESADNYKAGYQRFLNDYIKEASISKFETQDQFEQNKFNLTMDFASAMFGQLMQDRLLVFKPGITPASVPELNKVDQRTAPVMLRAGIYRKTVRVKLPNGFTFDEQPVPWKKDSDFAHISLEFSQEPGVLVMTEEIRTEAVTVPAEQFNKVKKFFDECRGADRQEVVLVKN